MGADPNEAAAPDRATQDGVTTDRFYSQPNSPLPAFPLDALPSRYGEYGAALAESLQVSTAMVGPLILAVLAVPIQGRIGVRIRTDWRVPPRSGRGP